MTILDVLQKRLVADLEVVKTKEMAQEYEIVFAVSDGLTTKGYLPKTCAPGMHNDVADRTIFNAMCSFALKRKDVDDAQHWLDMIQNIGIRRNKK